MTWREPVRVIVVVVMAHARDDTHLRRTGTGNPAPRAV
jgi:hypothetical protein